MPPYRVLRHSFTTHILVLLLLLIRKLDNASGRNSSRRTQSDKREKVLKPHRDIIGLRQLMRVRLQSRVATSWSWQAAQARPSHRDNSRTIIVGLGGSVLGLVPSLVLLSHTVREWASDADAKLQAFAVCSDWQVGRRIRRSDDMIEMAAVDRRGKKQYGIFTFDPADLR